MTVINRAVIGFWPISYPNGVSSEYLAALTELLDLLCMWGTDRSETGGDVAVNSIKCSQCSTACSCFHDAAKPEIPNTDVQPCFLQPRVGRFISSSYMWHCRVERSRPFMSGILRLGQHINLPSQPRMPRETSAETNDDPGSFSYPAAAQSRDADHGALEMHTEWPYFWEPRIRWLCSYIQRKTGKIWRRTSASVALKSRLMCGIVNSVTKQQHDMAVHIRFHKWKVALSDKPIAAAVDCFVVLLRRCSNRRWMQRVIFRTQRSLTQRLDH